VNESLFTFVAMLIARTMGFVHGHRVGWRKRDLR
jgi:hypothetical protein